MAKKSLHERASMARIRAGFERESDAAAAIGCSRTLVISWETPKEKGGAKSIGGRYLLPAAAAYRVRPEWLAMQTNDDGYPFSRNAPAPSTDDAEWSDIRGFAQAIGLGSGREAEEYEETHKLKFRRASLERKRLSGRDLAVVYGKGDSMLPRIKPGDAILFDVSDKTPVHGSLFVIHVDGVANREYNVKRCKIVDDLVIFEADNPSGDHGWSKGRRMDNRRHPIVIEGRVRWIGSWED